MIHSISKADRIYRVVADIKTPTEVLNADRPAWAVPPNAKDEFPEVESFVRITNDEVLVRKGDIKFQEENSMWADSSFFHVFDFKLLKGNPQTGLKDPFSIVFSETAAKKYFGNARSYWPNTFTNRRCFSGKGYRRNERHSGKFADKSRYVFINDHHHPKV